jgi:glycosyltransferase involved in cell wall biosynthesis
MGPTCSSREEALALMKVLFVIPAYNEEESIRRVVETVRAAGYDYVVINDGSSDRTAEICRDNGINFVNLFYNLGIGGAVQTGHLYALHHGYDVDIQFDGDGQHDIGCVPALLEGIKQGNDLVIGSRFLEPTDGFQSTGLRRFGIRWLSRRIRSAAQISVTDPTSGFRACSRRAIELFAKNYPIDYPEPESIVAAHNQGLKVSEVPVIMHERQGGTSSINIWKGAYYMVKVSLAISIEARKGRRP